MPVKSSKPLDQTSLSPSVQTPYLNLDSQIDPDTNSQILKGRAVVVVDPQTGLVGGIRILPPAGTGSTSPYVTAIGDSTGLGVYGLWTNTPMLLYNVGTGNFNMARTPSIFKAGSGNTNGDNTIWTPAAGKKFRIMGLVLANGTANAQTIAMKDNTGGTIVFTVVLPATIGAFIQWNLNGNGYLSSAANNVLDMNISSANNVYYSVWGTEE